MSISTINKQIFTITQVFFTFLLLFFLFRHFDWQAFLGLFDKISIYFFASSLSVIFIGQALFTLKWMIVLRSMGVSVSFFELFEYGLIGMFFNNFLPTSIGGDGFRIYYLGKKEGYMKIGASVFIDRFLGFFSMTAFAALLCWTIPGTSQAFFMVRNILLALFLVFVIAIIFARVPWVENVFLKIFNIHKRLAIFQTNFEKVFREIRIISKKYWMILGCMGIVFAYYFFLAIVYGEFFNTMSDNRIPNLSIMTVLLSIGILSNIPISINGIGLREQLHFLLFAAFGLPKEVTVSISLLIFADILIVSVLGYVFWIRLKIKKNDKP